MNGRKKDTYSSFHNNIIYSDYKVTYVPKALIIILCVMNIYFWS